MNDKLVNGAADIALAVTTGGIGNVAKAAILGGGQVILDMVKFATQIMTGFFLMCSIYLPMVPFVVFMGQVLNWLITVVEGVSAAPFLAFAHLDTDGEGLGQKTHYGYTFMLQSFMRPVMLVLGFMFSCILLEAIGGYVMQIYPTVMANAQMDSVTGLFSILGFTALFFVIMAGLVNTCMTVMYLLPDAIFSFIGAHNSATASVGRDEARNMKDGMLAGAAVSRQGNASLDRNGAAMRRGAPMPADLNGKESGVQGSGGFSPNK
jgi:conjugal transfer/type IV secretion protein DotA/TraY